VGIPTIFWGFNSQSNYVIGELITTKRLRAGSRKKGGGRERRVQ